MELPSLISQLLRKAAPTTATENNRINDDCRLWYEKLVKTAIDKQKEEKPLSLVDKGVLQLDSWYVRLAIAMSYFFILRFIQDLMNPGEDAAADEINDVR